MKKLIATIVIIALIIVIAVFHGISGYSKEPKLPTENNVAIQEATSKIISENGLEDWTISVTPRLGASIQYNGKSTIQDLVIKLSTGITLEIPTLEPNSPIKMQGKETIYLGKVNVNLKWIDKGQKHSGNVIFQIDSVK